MCEALSVRLPVTGLVRWAASLGECGLGRALGVGVHDWAGLRLCRPAGARVRKVWAVDISARRSRVGVPPARPCCCARVVPAVVGATRVQFRVTACCAPLYSASVCVQRSPVALHASCACRGLPNLRPVTSHLHTSTPPSRVVMAAPGITEPAAPVHGAEVTNWKVVSPYKIYFRHALNSSIPLTLTYSVSTLHLPRSGRSPVPCLCMVLRHRPPAQ